MDILRELENVETDKEEPKEEIIISHCGEWSYKPFLYHEIKIGDEIKGKIYFRVN
jgi:hypothetical protein